MPFDTAERLDLDRRTLTATAEIVAAVTADQLDDPSPCAGWTLRDLLGHMVASNEGFAAAASGAPVGGEVWDRLTYEGEPFEALLRWIHPTRGVVGPDEFIPIAEESGLIIDIGRYVLNEACRQAKEWQKKYRPGLALMVSINISGKHFQQITLIDEVADALKKSGIDPSQVILEITETVMVRDAEGLGEVLKALKALGVRLVLDDFGTGYSSLSYLTRLPLDVLKVDRSFVDGLGSDPSDSAIVTAIVTLAHTLGLSAIAEGVETTDHLAELRRLQCDMAQGFHMARPAPGSDTGEVLAQRQRW